MNFQIKYIQNGEIKEDVRFLDASHYASSGKIFTAARALLDGELGVWSPVSPTYTLLRIRSYPKPIPSTPEAAISQTVDKKAAKSPVRKKPPLR